MTAREILMPDAALGQSAVAGNLKTARLRANRQQRNFQDVLEKAATGPQRAAGGGRRNSLQTAIEAATPLHVTDLRVQPKNFEADKMPAVATGMVERRFAEAETGETGISGRQNDTEDKPASETSDSGAVSVKLEQLIASVLPVPQPPTGIRARDTFKDTSKQDAGSQPADPAMLPLPRANTSPVDRPEARGPDRDAAVKPAAPPIMEAEPLPASRVNAAKPASPAASRTKEEPPAASSTRLESVTVTRVETVLVPAASGMGQLITRTEVTQPAAPLAATAAAWPAPSPQAVVKTIEFRLQPEELGPVKVALHMRGDELRVQVEVTTREAHALLQRDKSQLSSVLEKAGYEVSDAALTITLRPEVQPMPVSTASNDSSSFQRSNSNTAGESFQHPAGGEQSRQAARQPEREDHHGRRPASEANEAGRPAGARGIYL